ncbi:MAG: sigma-70 family RNA polymerase sigma factor, partial [Acidimicrobiia bacterium]|nr:sigma-70 family RNA polymerase sigma factor [Acidimicrobiia bacterium]
MDPHFEQIGCNLCFLWADIQRITEFESGSIDRSAVFDIGSKPHLAESVLSFIIGARFPISLTQKSVPFSDLPAMIGCRALKNPENRPDPRELLEAFVASKRSERTFTALVESLGRLVYSSAHRRTGNPQLAEEITQNVFAVLARKAESLRRHPSLQAWILETTRLQAASAMRSERRRQRKLAAMKSEADARQSEVCNPMENLAAWKEAVPHLDKGLDRLSEKERKIIVQRFYEGRKFREIAAARGESEGACKKRVKRALDKLSRVLSARGVTLSTTVVASALGTELARSAPLHSAAV